MHSIEVILEIGKKKVFASAVDWPGWCRSGRDEEKALKALLDYGPRYAMVLQGGNIAFQPPSDVSYLFVTGRHPGNATTDFGAPVTIPDSDREPMDLKDFEHLYAILEACWRTFDRAVNFARGRELRKGPRGGGRDLDKILEHVIGADQGYLSRLAWKHKREGGLPLIEELRLIRQAIVNALEVTPRGDLPERGPRGGVIWPPRYFIRRVAWHVLDHAWEIEDRIL